jgi:DNA-binding HxlR family transcriptional regulator
MTAHEPRTGPDLATPASPNTCHAREVLDRIGDKWSVYVIATLGGGTRRFTELRRNIDGISQRMLTVTLRGLERDGIITRTVHPVIPPRVDYALTPMGESLLETVAALVHWSEAHTQSIQQARARYDRDNQPPGQESPIMPAATS